MTGFAAIYQNLVLPSRALPQYLFGIVWSILYVIIIISFGFVALKFFKKKIPTSWSLPFIINLVANLGFSYVQFNLMRFDLAVIDILIVWLTIIWIIVLMWKKYRRVALAQIPYLLRVSIATVLQIYVRRFN